MKHNNRRTVRSNRDVTSYGLQPDRPNGRPAPVELAKQQNVVVTELITADMKQL